MALYLCNWRWHQSAAERPPQEREQAFAKVFSAAENASPIGAQRLKGWYTFAGRQTAGFLIIEAQTAEELAQILRPYTELMTFEAQPIVAVDYAQARQRMLGKP